MKRFKVIAGGSEPPPILNLNEVGDVIHYSLGGDAHGTGATTHCRLAKGGVHIVAWLDDPRWCPECVVMWRKLKLEKLNSQVPRPVLIVKAS